MKEGPGIVILLGRSTELPSYVALEMCDVIVHYSSHVIKQFRMEL